MTDLARGLRAVLIIFLLVVPAIGAADPILGPDTNFPVSGWSNAHGTFAVDSPVDLLFDPFGRASYSTASSLFSSDGQGLIRVGSSGTNLYSDILVEFDAIVQETGTVSGNLLGGVLTVRAGLNGAPEAGITPGEMLIVGYAIDAAALDRVANVEFLFALTYTNPALYRSAQYLTYFGAYPGSWGGTIGPPIPFEPWGRDWGPYGGVIEDSFAITRLVSEPSAFALAALGLMLLRLRKR